MQETKDVISLCIKRASLMRGPASCKGRTTMDLITSGKLWRGAKLLSLPQAGPEDVVHPASVKQNPFNHTPQKTEHISSRPGLGAAAANASGQTTDIR